MDYFFTHFDVDSSSSFPFRARTLAETIEMSHGGLRNPVSDESAHWRHPANTLE